MLVAAVEVPKMFRLGLVELAVAALALEMVLE